MKLRYMLLGLFLCFEVANFTGFSWTRLRRLSDEELINSAIQSNYPDIYSNLAELKADYSSFNPEVYYWTDLTGEVFKPIAGKLFGLKQPVLRGRGDDEHWNGGEHRIATPFAKKIPSAAARQHQVQQNE